MDKKIKFWVIFLKYLVLLCDGMADRPFGPLDNKTPMELAYKPTMDALAKGAELGLCKTVPDTLKPGSDVANLSVMGYNPLECYTGRSPLEAASIGIALSDSDVSLRCNLVTLSDHENYRDKVMLDYSGGDISTAEAKELIGAVQEAFGNDKFAFYAGVAYRHCLVVKDGTLELGNMTPPHDISGKVIGEHLSTHTNAAPLIEMMEKSYDVLKDHPINLERIKKGEAPANAIWFWGEGSRPALDNFYDTYGIKGGVISAVDLLKGIAFCANMESADVEGATGYIDTNFDGKKDAAIKMWQNGCDLVYLHLEAPDECGHRGQADLKVKSIEIIDQKVLSPLVEYLKEQGDYTILIMPDHPTPLEIKTHSREAVPYLLYRSNKAVDGADCFTEKTATATGNYLEEGYKMMKKVLA